MVAHPAKKAWHKLSVSPCSNECFPGPSQPEDAVVGSPGAGGAQPSWKPRLQDEVTGKGGATGLGTTRLLGSMLTV